MEYSFDLVREFCNLHNKHGNALFALIEEVTDKMTNDDQERFFVDDLSHRIALAYEPTDRDSTQLPLEVFDYFNNAKEASAGAFYRYDHLKDDPAGAEVRELNFSPDVGELLAVLTNQVQL
ncbi:hypothetical protein GLGCALEP_06366 [Pseudomonas sp. MM221]|nr:hypothetical protein DBADOPDK_06211 [Pseudomonas sp. MM223]CAI3811102.1 hypothetical protein GLGCALEP_06366 [Pseudomonas sp. MM221]